MDVDDGHTGSGSDSPIQQRIEQKLRANLNIEYFDIVDTSGNCGSSFAITVVSPNFVKKMTLARHKLGTMLMPCLVNQLLADEISVLHAFSQKTLTPEQWKAEKSK